MNSVALVGRLTRDPELRKTPAGQSVVIFTIAITRKHVKDSEHETADFVPCKAWGKTAEYLCTYGQKGTMLSAEGRNSTYDYTDKAGQRIRGMEVVIDRVQMISNYKKSNEGNAHEAEGEPRKTTWTADDLSQAIREGAESLETNPDDLPF